MPREGRISSPRVASADRMYCDIIKPSPLASLMAWMMERNDQDLFISSFTVAEIPRGVLAKPAGKRTARKGFVGVQILNPLKPA